MRDFAESAAVEIGDGGACAASRADSAAIGAQPADAGFEMDGQQVGKKHGAHHLVAADVQLLGIFHHRDGGGDALIATAGDDDDRHFATAHARVGACRGHITGAGIDADAVMLLEHGADIRAPAMPHAFFSDGVVVVDLALDQCPNVFQIAGGGEVEHPFYGQAGAIRQHVTRAVG